MFIALLTDFGTSDYFVGAMKGVIYRIDPRAVVVDITHEIEPQNIRSASFTLRACCRDFPPNTIFVAVVDPGVGSRRRAILAAAGDYFFIAPDNGLLSPILQNADNHKVFELSNPEYFNHPVSKTFHGRDIFAPAAAHLSSGTAPERFGPEINDFIVLDKAGPRLLEENIIETEIIHIDRFGNLVTDIEIGDLPENFRLELGGVSVTKKYQYFAEAAPDEIFMIPGSAGLLEVAANQNSAKNLLNVRTGDKIKVIMEK